MSAEESALTDGKRALALHRQVGNRAYEAHTLACLAETYARTAEVASAESAYRQALVVFAELGDRFGEASMYAHLADLVDDADARRRAEAILRELDEPAAAQLALRLR